MSGYGIQGDFADLQEMVKGLAVGEDALRKATTRAINKTAKQSMTWLSKKIRQDYKIRAADVKAELKLIPATYNSQEATIVGAGKPGIPLYKFYPTPKGIPSTVHLKGQWQDRYTWYGKQLKGRMMVEGSDKYLPKIGVKVMVRKGRRKHVQGGFIQRMRSGHVGIFRRERGAPKARTGRSKIRELYGPSPVRLMDSDYIQIPLDDFAGETLDRLMTSEANNYLKRAGLL